MVTNSLKQMYPLAGVTEHLTATSLRRTFDSMAMQRLTTYKKRTSCSILVDFENAEISNPSPRKGVRNRTIYCSRKLGIPKKHGRPVLADFGEARFGSDTGTYCNDVQPFIYRAPEMLLRMPWNEKIDIWNIAVLAWDIF